jgi:glycosyltransferase involved in cell wall biosynthesis
VKILILSNYALSNNQSMMRFADLLVQGLSARGHRVEVLRPSPVLGRLFPKGSSIGKLIGTVDRFIIFPLSLRFRSFDADVLHIPDHGNAVYLSRLSSIPNVVTCHDVQPYRSARGEIAENKLGIFGRIYQEWVLSWLKRSQYLPCVSETTLREWEQLTGTTSSANTSVIDPALTYPYAPMSKDEAGTRLHRLLGERELPFVIHVGSNVWYKNRVGVARIFDALVDHEEFRDARLVVAGRHLTPEVRNWLVARGHGGRLQELGPVEDEDLRALYSSASLLLFPSLLEGFGMPIIEAQACGCLVATSNRSPMREAGGNGTILIDPVDSEAAAAAIVERWPARETIKLDGLANAKRYAVDTMISRYIELYAQAAKAGTVGQE